MAFILALSLSACIDDPGPTSDGASAVIGWDDYEFQDYPLSGAGIDLKSEAILEGCVYDGKVDSSFRGCTLGDAPFIGMLSMNPDVDTIMSRVLVSRPWMAQRFRQVLEALPPEVLNLFRPLTAIVISHDIRPSFYYSMTGAIYIDPGYLWMTEEEFLETPQFDDYRADFGKDLAFDQLARYVEGNDYASVSGKTYKGDRGFRDVLLGTARLLAHELAHANDYVPRRALSAAHPRAVPLDIVLAYGYYKRAHYIGGGSYSRYFAGPESSYLLGSSYNLSAESLYCSARVMFEGGYCSAARDYVPADISAAFQQDRGNDLYNYTADQEDLAMVFEEFFMQHFFGISRDLAVTNNPAEPATAADYTVDWGQRGRIGDPSIRPRTEFVVSRLLPEINAAAAVAALPEPIELRAGDSWLDNLDPSAAGLSDNMQKQRVLQRDMSEDQAGRREHFVPSFPGEDDFGTNTD